MMKGKLVAAIPAAILVVGVLGWPILQPLPPSARVVLDYESRTYATWPCIVAGTVEVRYTERAPEAFTNPFDVHDLRPTATAVDLDEARRTAHRAGGGPDKACRDAGGFMKRTSYAEILWARLRR